MIQRTVKIQLAAFVVLTALGITYLGLQLIGIDALRPPFTIKAHFAASGGIFTNAEVTYRGVGVGRVGELRLLGDGVEVELELDHGKRVPRDTIAVVANKSAVGEQYVDLQPRSDSGPYLANGDVIPMADTRVPIDINTFVVDMDRLARSVDLVKLRSLISEMGDAFEGTGPALRQLISAGDELTATLTAKLPETISLIREGRLVLETARDTSTDFRRFADGLADLSDALRSVDPDVRRLLDNGVVAAQQLDTLLKPRQAALHVLLSDLVTINQLQVERLDALEQTLISLPIFVEKGQIPLIDGQLRNGLVNEREAHACTYEDTPRHLPRDYDPNRPANTKAECPPGEDGQRGAKSVHRGSDSDSGSPGAAPGPASGPASGRASGGAPGDNGSARPAVSSRDGAAAQLGWTGGQRDLLGERSWLALLLALL